MQRKRTPILQIAMIFARFIFYVILSRNRNYNYETPKRRNRNFSDPNISLFSNFIQISIKTIRSFPHYDDFPLFKQQAYSNLPKPQKGRNEDLDNPIFASLVKHDPRWNIPLAIHTNKRLEKVQKVQVSSRPAKGRFLHSSSKDEG